MNTATFQQPSHFTDAAEPALGARILTALATTAAAISEGAAAAHTYRHALGRGLGEKEATRRAFEQHFAGH